MKPHDRKEWIWIGLLIVAVAVQVGLVVWSWVSR